MKRLFVIIFALVCSVAYSDSFARKPTKRELKKAELEAKIEQWKKEQEKELEREINRIVYIDTIRIDSLSEVPIYYDYNHHLMMPKILYHNRADYIEFAFDDTDKTKYYCATGRGEAETYRKARHMALVDAVMKIRKIAGNDVKLDSAELLMDEEDKLDDDFIEHLIEDAKLNGDTALATAFALKASKDRLEVVVAIRILKNM